MRAAWCFHRKPLVTGTGTSLGGIPQSRSCAGLLRRFSIHQPPCSRPSHQLHFQRTDFARSHSGWVKNGCRRGKGEESTAAAARKLAAPFITARAWLPVVPLLRQLVHQCLSLSLWKAGDLARPVVLHQSLEVETLACSRTGTCPNRRLMMVILSGRGPSSV